jgi:hypothetical protein
MSDASVRLIEDALRATLGSHGLDTIEVRAEEDHDGEPSLFIDAILKPNTPLIEAEVYNEAHRVVSDALLNSGDRRFPYLFLRHPDEERAEP